MRENLQILMHCKPYSGNLKKVTTSQSIRIFVAVLIVCTTILRLIMSLTLHMWFAPSQSADDELLMRQSYATYYSSDDKYKMAKNQGFSYFLRLMHWSRINVDVVYFLLWLIAAVFVSYSMYVLFKKVLFSAFAYLYVLWNPLAFENWVGTRVYRNSIFAPCMFIFISLLIIYIESSIRFEGFGSIFKIRTFLLRLLTSLSLGIVFAFIYILKEDSIWLLPMFLSVIIFKFIRTLLTRQRKIWACILSLILVSLPSMTAFCGVNTIKYINYKNFGVYLLNTRTEGEFAGFIKRVYQIKSDQQSPYLWTPKDSIDQAFSASPTLQSVQGLQYFVEHKDFASPDIGVHPLRGEFLSWQMINAIDATVGWRNEKDVQVFFSKVNDDLDTAFENGKLQKTNKFSPTSSLVPRSVDEINELWIPAIRIYSQYILLGQFNKTTGVNSTSMQEINTSGLRQLNIDVNNPNPVVFSFLSFQQAQDFSLLLSRIYRYLNILFLICFVFSVIMCVIRGAKHNYLLKNNILSILLFVYSACYSFIIAWYVQYLDTNSMHVAFFNSAGMAGPLVYIGLLIAVGTLFLYYKIP